MKKVVVFMVLLIIAASLFAQTNENTKSAKDSEMQTLFSEGKNKIGGYVAPDLKVTQINNKVGVLSGGRVGMIFNNVISIGFAGYSLETFNNFDLPNYNQSKLGMGYGGLMFEYISASNDVVHFTANTLVGAGGAQIKDDSFDDDKTYEHSAFFVVEPCVMMDVNISKHFRLGLGASYRFVTGVDMPSLRSKDLSGVSANLVLKFGMFNGFELPGFIKKHLDEHER